MKKTLFIIFLASSLFADPGNIFLAKGVIDPNAPEISASECKSGTNEQLLSGSGDIINQTAPIPLEWESECIGVSLYYTGANKEIDYVYTCTLHIDDFWEIDENIKGTVDFKFYKPGINYGTWYSRVLLTPDYIGDYECSAKAAFTGTLKADRDVNRYTITMKLEDLISGRFPQGFSPVTFYGLLWYRDLTEILWGDGEGWRTYFKSKYEMPKDEYYDSGFVAVAEKNLEACAHNNNFDNKDYDFFLEGELQIFRISATSGLFKKLKFLAASKGEVNNLVKKLVKKWDGACYGISATMALVFRGKLKPKDISGEDVESYYQLKAPKDNIYFRDVIHYYHLSQYLDDFGKFKLAKKKWESKNDSQMGGDRLHDVLSGLVKDAKIAAKEHRVLMISYGVGYTEEGEQKEGGHAILVTAYKYKKKEQIYDLTLYDMNKRVFTHMEIPEDCDSFKMDATKGPITLANCLRLCYIDPDKIMQVRHLNSQKNTENYTFICFSSDSSFKLTSDAGLSLMYDNNEFSGDLPLLSLDYIDDDIKIKTSYCSSYKIEPISKDIDINIYDNDHFKAIEGSDIESIDVSIPGDMKLKGDAYTFKAYASVEEMLDEKESGMGSIFAKGKGEVVIHPGQNTVEATSKKPMSGIKTEVYQGVDVIEGTIKGNQKKVVLKVTEDADNQNLENGGMIIFAKSGYAYRGRPIKPFVSVYVGGKSLKKNKEFKVQYENNVEVGTGKITVTGVGEYSGTLTAEFPIIPKKVKMKKVTSCKSGFEVTWKASGPKDGFEIQYAADPDFKNVETKKIEDGESSSAQVEGLEIGGEYFVRMRAYKTEAETGITYNSNWSDVKSVLIYPY